MRQSGRKAESLIHTSVDDCRCTIQFWGPDDIPELERAQQIACDNNHKTRAQVIGRHLRKLKREVAHV